MTSYKKQRLMLIILSVTSISVAMVFLLYFFRSSLVYFYGPSELPPILNPQQIIRIGGLVEKNSLQRQDDYTQVCFWVTDDRARIKIVYHGQLPDLFREGQGVVAEGILDANGIFQARQVLAKHDENYRPPELQRALDKAAKADLNRSLKQP